MDLKQPISLASIGAGKKKISYPTKTVINLVDVGGARIGHTSQIGLFLVLLVLVGLFAKFAVIDPLASGMNSSAQLAAAETQLAQLKEENANYAELNEQYARYVVTGLTDDEQNLTIRGTILDLIETQVMSVGYLASVKVVGNTATVTSLGADLNQVSQLVETLKDDNRVAYVTVSTAQGETDASTSATIQIAFKGALDASSDGEGN